MKREYSYWSILIILIINVIIITLLSKLEVETKILRPIISAILNFIIFSGLLHTRKGGIKEYFSNIKRFNIRAICVNVVVAMASVLFLFFIMLAAPKGGVSSAITNNPDASVGIIFALIIGTIIISLLLNYMNLILVDERYEDYSFVEILKLIIKTGFNLTFESIKVWAKYYLVSIIVLVGFLTYALIHVEENIFFAYGFLFTAVIISLCIYIFLITPVYMARVSDVYIDYSDYDIYKNKEDIDMASIK